MIQANYCVLLKQILPHAECFTVIQERCIMRIKNKIIHLRFAKIIVKFLLPMLNAGCKRPCLDVI